MMERQNLLHVLAELGKFNEHDLDSAILLYISDFIQVIHRQHRCAAVKATYLHRSACPQANDK